MTDCCSQFHRDIQENCIGQLVAYFYSGRCLWIGKPDVWIIPSLLRGGPGLLYFVGFDDGHWDTFITHEFIYSIVYNHKPEVDIYQALAYTAPGIVAHQSALKGGMLMKIPDFDEVKK